MNGTIPELAYQIDNVSIVMENRTIVKTISFNLPIGSSLAIIGPNGAGKSTLLKSLLGLLHPQTGKIYLFGKDIRHYKRREIAKLVGYVPQAAGIEIPYTVREFVLLARYAYLNPFSHFTETDDQIVWDSMVQADVAELEHRRLPTLSGGERQKVFIAAALAQQPRVMLLDEATAFLDYRHQVEITGLVLKLRKEIGLSVICVTHDLNQGVLSYDGVLALKSGSAVFTGSPKELFQEECLSQIYDTPFHLYEEPETKVIFVVPGKRIV